MQQSTILSGLSKEETIEFLLILELITENNALFSKEKTDQASQGMVLKLLEWHRLIPYVNEEKTGQLLSTQLSASIREYKKNIVVRNIVNLQELEILSTCFNDNGIPFIVLKGIALSQLLHNDFAKRQSRDIDLLIEESNAQIALDLLLKNEYIPFEHHFTPNKFSTFRKRNFHIGLIHRTKRIVVELHWKLGYYPVYFSKTDAFFQHQEQIQIANLKLCALSPEDAILFMITHGSKHAWFRLFWLYDTAIAFKNLPIDISQLMTKAYAIGIKKDFIQTLKLLQYFFPSFLPPDAIRLSETENIPAFLIQYPIQRIYNIHFQSHLSFSQKVKHFWYHFLLANSSSKITSMLVKLKHQLA